MGEELVDCHSMHSPLDVEGVLHTDTCAIPKHAMVHTRHNSSMLKQLLQTNFQHSQGEIANCLSSNGARSRYFTHSHMHIGHDGCMAFLPQIEQPDTAHLMGPPTLSSTGLCPYLVFVDLNRSHSSLKSFDHLLHVHVVILGDGRGGRRERGRDGEEHFSPMDASFAIGTLPCSTQNLIRVHYDGTPITVQTVAEESTATLPLPPRRLCTTTGPTAP